MKKSSFKILKMSKNMKQWHDYLLFSVRCAHISFRFIASLLVQRPPVPAPILLKAVLHCVAPYQAQRRKRRANRRPMLIGGPPQKGFIWIIKNFSWNFIGIVFLTFWVWMKELIILDLRFGFYVKNYPYGQPPRSKLTNPCQNMRKQG